MHRNWWGLVVAFALVAGACGGGGDDSGDDAGGDDPTTTSGASGDSGDGSDSSDAAPAEPTVPLLGLPLDDDSLLEMPALVVKIGNNERASQPQVGLNDADIVFEEYVEGVPSATRFAAVFHSTLPDAVGPIRSARTTDRALMLNLNSPVFAYSGSNEGTRALLVAGEADGHFTLVADRGIPPFYRDDERPAPYDLFAAPSDLLEDIEGTAPAPVFQYGDATGGSPNAGIVTTDVRFAPEWTWDPDDGVYKRFSDGRPHLVDDGSTQLVADNVVVLFVEYTRSPADPATPEAQTIGQGGEVWVLRDGQIQIGEWVRPFEPAPYVLTTTDGQPIPLKPGRTWVLLARVGSTAALSDGEAQARLEMPLDEG